MKKKKNNGKVKEKKTAKKKKRKESYNLAELNNTLSADVVRFIIALSGFGRVCCKH